MRLEFEQSGKRDLFDRLKGFVWGEKNGLSYTDMAAQLGMTEGAVKVAVTRLRQKRVNGIHLGRAKHPRCSGILSSHQSVPVAQYRRPEKRQCQPSPPPLIIFHSTL